MTSKRQIKGFVERGQAAQQAVDEIVAASNPAPNPAPRPAKSLAEIRSSAIAASSSAAHTIAELEAWRNEIDATIAFLKAQRK
jgi:hypothetical protein